MALPPPDARSRRPAPLTLAVAGLAVFVVGLLGGGGVAWLQRNSADAVVSTSTPVVTPTGSIPTSLPTESTTPASSPTSDPTTSSPSPTETALTRQQVETRDRQRLEDLADAGYTQARPRGQWVAQLSSKYIGIRDPEQTTHDGSHTFAASDIIDEFVDTRRQARALGHTVVLIKGPDISKGRGETSGHLFWYMFALGMSKSAEAEGFCAELYPDLLGDALDNRCFATRLNP